MNEVIDSHQHFWRLDRGDYHWLTPKLAQLNRDFLPSDLQPLLDASGVGKTVLVQATDTLAETRYLLSLAEEAEFVAAVVGWVDMRHDGAIDALEELADNPRFVGIRPMLQDLPEDDWILDPSIQPVLEALQRRHLTFDALVKPRHLRRLLTLLDRHPELPVVIDHGAKPDIAYGCDSDWQADIAALASLDNCYCKLSGLVTEAGADPEAGRIRPYAQHLLDHFGAEKVMWGSDWPVLNLAGSYLDWLAMSRGFITHLTVDEQRRVMGGTAADFYGLGR